MLKHRRRKEKAARKLDSMAANLARLTDPDHRIASPAQTLGRQAEMARRAQTIQADLRDARLRLAADDLVARRLEFTGADDTETVLRREHEEAAEGLATATEQLAAHEAAVATLSERTDAAQQTWFRLSALAERVAATIGSPPNARNTWRPNKPPAPAPTPTSSMPKRMRSQLEERLQTELARPGASSGRPRRAERKGKRRVGGRAGHLAAVRAEADRREDSHG